MIIAWRLWFGLCKCSVCTLGFLGIYGPNENFLDILVCQCRPKNPRAVPAVSVFLSLGLAMEGFGLMSKE